MRTIAIPNYKGGVRKTTTAVNLSSIFVSQGMRVLLVDLDPQASATDFFDLYEDAESGSSVDLLYRDAPVSAAAHETGTANLWCVPSTIDLIDQNELMLREQRLRFALDDASDDFDVAVIDCSPTLKRLAFNAYVAAAAGGMVVIPVKLDAAVMRGTAFTVNAIRSISDTLRIPVPEWKVLRTCVPGRMTKSERIGAEVLDANFPGMQFRTVIHQSAKVGEGSWQWAPVVEFNPGSRPAKDYLALAEEVLHG